jgi:hypothetical protein
MDAGRKASNEPICSGLCHYESERKWMDVLVSEVARAENMDATANLTHSA